MRSFLLFVLLLSSLASSLTYVVIQPLREGPAENDGGGISAMSMGAFLQGTGCSKHVSQKECEDIKAHIATYARANFPSSCRGEFSIDLFAAVIDSQISLESNYNPNARNSKSSATGISQFIDSTARKYRLYDRFDARESIRAQAEYMSDILNLRWIRCNLPLALGAYVVGENNAMIKTGKVPYSYLGNKPCEYSAKIMNRVGGLTGIYQKPICA